MNKTVNEKAWLFVIPVFILVAFNAAVPLMTVVNYSFQETFGSNVFAWEGTRWFKEILHSERFHASLGRQVIFTFVICLGFYLKTNRTLKKLEKDFIKEAESLSKKEFENLKKQKIAKEILVSHSKK